MKIKTLTLVMALMALGAGQAFAQKHKAEPQEGDSKSRPAAQRPESDGRVLLAAGSTIEGSLNGTVDVRKARVGDEVILKTTKAVRHQGETVVPKGASIIGRITDVRRKGGDNGTSAIGMVFERIEGRSLSAPLTATIVSVTNAQAGASAGDSETDLFGNASTSSSARSSGGSSGGLLGGVGSTVGGVVGATTETVGGVAGTATRTAGSAAGELGGTLSGLRITQSAGGSATGSTTLSAAGRDLRLEKGVTFRLLLDSEVRNQ